MFPIPFNFPFRKKDGSLTNIGDAISEGGGSYTLPTASANVKGGVKIGAGLTMDGETLKNTNPTPPTPYTLPPATADTLGGVKVGNNLSIDENGVLSASGGGGGSDTGWVEFNGVGTNKFEYRVINNVVYIRMTAGGSSGGSRAEVGTVPNGFRPDKEVGLNCPSAGFLDHTDYDCRMFIQTSGKIWLGVASPAGNVYRPVGVISYPLPTT